MSLFVLYPRITCLARLLASKHPAFEFTFGLEPIVQLTALLFAAFEILMLDGDTPGRHAGAIIAARLVTKLSVRVVEVPTGTQPDQLSADQIRCVCDPDFF